MVSKANSSILNSKLKIHNFQMLPVQRANHLSARIRLNWIGAGLLIIICLFSPGSHPHATLHSRPALDQR